MISLRLIYKKQSKTTAVGNDHQAILNRALEGCKFNEGDKVRVKGGRLMGVIQEIVRIPDEIVWQGSSPKFLLVLTANGKLQFAHPRQLKKVMK